MTAPETAKSPLDMFVAPLLGLPAWGVKQGHGSFLTLEFGQPELIVSERQSTREGTRRHAYVRGRWNIWIYCCAWRLSMHGDERAWSEDAREDIARATGLLDGQKLIRVSAEPSSGRSRFEFDLGGLLETWPVGDDALTEQWFIDAPGRVFAYRADGHYHDGSGDTAPEDQRWAPLSA